MNGAVDDLSLISVNDSSSASPRATHGTRTDRIVESLSNRSIEHASHDSVSLPKWPSDPNDVDANDDENYSYLYNDSCIRENESLEEMQPPLSTIEAEERDYDHVDEKKVLLSSLEKLSLDISSTILTHLSVYEISQVGLVSKTLYKASRNSQLWKSKFRARWNYDTSSATIDWFRAYQHAYWNTDDLWITHWNCVDPCDGLSPGRCCIDMPTRRSSQNIDSTKKVLCPTCRYHPTIHPSGRQYPTNISTDATAIAAATRIRLDQQQKFPQRYPSPLSYTWQRSQRAFSQAATLHRTIDCQQYQSNNNLAFLSDLLFFQVYESFNELEELKKLFLKSRLGNAHPVSETALHSWHVCHFTNPDYERSLSWRISIMRKDCFAVYPSEGYLKPGESQVVVFGVRPLASLLAHASQQLDAHREGVDAFWANVYAEEAHLPPAPFLIHYRYASDDDTKIQVSNTASSDSDALRTQSTPWQRSNNARQHVRIMYLSAHVNAQYSLSDFRRSTLVPFSMEDTRCASFVAPQLMEFFPHLAHILDRNDMERIHDQGTRAHCYRTDGPCEGCSRRWGRRFEELGQAFVICKLECEIAHDRWEKIMRHHRRVLLSINDNLKKGKEWTRRYHRVCVELHDSLTNKRAIPWLTICQHNTILQWLSLIDRLCQKYHRIKDFKSNEGTDYFVVPWRHAGVYQNSLCTDSVYSLTNVSKFPTNSVLKKEPKYLDAFAHLAHSPGRFCLGPQEDPNHLRGLLQNSRYARRQRGCVTDMFFDDPICGLQAALCVISDPRSLMVHGIWDRVAYPGVLVRRPKIPKLPPIQYSCIIDLPHVSISRFLNENRKRYFEFQNNLDMESIVLVDSWCKSPNEILSSTSTADVPYPISLSMYLYNIPPVGSGRFPLYKITDTNISGPKFEAVTIFDELAMKWGSEDQGKDEEDVSARIRSANRPLHHHLRPAIDLPIQQGPRLFNLLWIISSHMGWTVDDNQGAESVYVDRRILIGAQWLSISLMAAPLFWTLVARFGRWIPATPVDYSLEALPFHVETELRYLSEYECGMFSIFLLCSWMCLGRWIERYTSRDFLRAMLEHLPSDDGRRYGLLQREFYHVWLGIQRIWDSMCPLFLQRMVFVPKWNRRSCSDLMKHIAFWRGHESSTMFQALSGGGFMALDSNFGKIYLGEVPRSVKILVSVIVSVASFAASTPHFFLNVLTVFSSSISLGLSMSLQSMETGRAGVTVTETGSFVDTLNLVTIVLFGFLVGQLIGSSGGILFLAEFVVTSISLLLGGAGTISAHAMESWGIFFCFAVTAFWGYMFGRVSIMEGIKQKQSGFSSVMLCISFFALAICWFIAMFVWKWETAVDLMIDRSLYHGDWANTHDKPAIDKLQ